MVHRFGMHAVRATCVTVPAANRRWETDGSTGVHRVATSVPMDNTVRPGARPPPIVRRPRMVPRAPWRGATPTKAALCGRVRSPTQGVPAGRSGHTRAPCPGHAATDRRLPATVGWPGASSRRRPAWRCTHCAPSYGRHSPSRAARAGPPGGAAPRSAGRSVAGGAHGGRAARASGRRDAAGASGGSRPHSGRGRGHRTPPLWRVGPSPGPTPGPAADGRRPRAGPPWPRRLALHAPGRRWRPAPSGWGRGPEAGPRASSPRWHHWGRPTPPRRGAGQCRTGLWPQQSHQSMARHSYARLSARPCRDGRNGPRHLDGLWESRT